MIEEKLDQLISLMNEANHTLNDIRMNSQISMQWATAQYRQQLLQQARYQEEKRLLRHGAKIFSQNDEDGIIREIFKRISPRSKTFFEFGVQATENNSLALLADGWKGTWLEANPDTYRGMCSEYKTFIDEGRLNIQQTVVNKHNINELLKKHSLSDELDLLSIDIDGNDIYVWKAINDKFRPRVVVIEYNGLFPPPIVFIQEDNPDKFWDGSAHSGASLKALEMLAELKGYSLVGCCFNGVNSFFVRNDLLGDYFAEPYTSENHYEPIRYTILYSTGWTLGSVGHFSRLWPFENKIQ